MTDDPLRNGQRQASAEPAPSADAATKTLGGGRYELLSVLGEGGMATVWRARDTLLGVERAIKVLHPDVAARKSYRSRFLAEARTMARLDHPNILRVFDVGEEEGGRYWFTMEVVEGGALIDLLEQSGRMGPLESLDLIFQLLQALAAAHLEGVVHRDVKPDNILLSPDGRARLSDFGIARIRNERVDHRTRTGVSMGTVGYMAPEQRENARGVGPAADLYAVGATLYALVTGCEPPDLFAAHIDPELLEGVPPAIREVVRKSTAYRPEKRYAHARQMAVDVAQAYDAIARGKGLPELGSQWLARFDDLVANRAYLYQGGGPKPEALTPSKPQNGQRAAGWSQSDLPPEAGEDVEPTMDPPVERTRTPAPEPQKSLPPVFGAGAPAEQTPHPIGTPVAPKPTRLPVAVLGLVALVAVALVVGAVAVMAKTTGAGDAAACAGLWEGTRAGPAGTGVPLRLQLTAGEGGAVTGEATTTFMGEQVSVPVEGRCDGGSLQLSETGDRPDRGEYTGDVHGGALAGSFVPEGGSPLRFDLARGGAPMVGGASGAR